MGIFITLIVMYAFVQTQQIIYIKYGQIFVYQLYSSKACLFKETHLG